jgi:hypothetical protein
VIVSGGILVSKTKKGYSERDILADHSFLLLLFSRWAMLVHQLKLCLQRYCCSCRQE